MKENSSLELNTPKKLNTTNEINLDKLSNEQIISSFSSTEVNSNNKTDISENYSPKKKQKVNKFEAIKTFCRIRPIKGTNEIFFVSKNDDKILNINSSNLEKLNVGNNLKLINSYKFSKVFNENSTQEEVFECTCKPLIYDLIFNHKSGLIFTYGMTNAGKTFTVIGTPEKPGILPQALKNLLEYNELKKEQLNNIYKCFYCNFVEIYNEEVFDLLSDDPTGKNKFFKKKLNVKENLNSIFFLQDVTFAKLDSLEDFDIILNKGISKKVHSSTNLNQNSSRSHTIFKVVLMNDSKDISKIDYSTEELLSLSVVDLAGSERQKRTDAKGKNLQEACKINQSLSTLGKCLEAMKHNSISNNKKLVPLRESKLTKIFAEYFQGDQNIIMITNINPRTEDFEETIRALNYSCIAKDIKPIKSIIPKLSSGNELKLQLKKEKKLNEVMNNTNNENKKNDEISSNINLTEKNNINEPNKNEQKLNDSLTLNLNEFFNSNLNFDENEMKTEFTHPPEDNTSIKEEMSKLIMEIKKLREEVKEYKSDNSEIKKSDILDNHSKSLSKSIKSLSSNKNNLTNVNNNINPFTEVAPNENNNRSMLNNDINNNSFNGDDSLISQDNNSISNSLVSNFNNNNLNNNLNSTNNIRTMNTMNNNMLVPYGNYEYSFNNHFAPFYNPNVFGAPFLSLPSPKNYNNNNQLINSGRGKKNNKKKKISDIINTAFNNLVPGMQNGINLIFINSKFGNLCPGQSIQEENSDCSDSDDDSSVPKKRKIKVKNKRNSRNKPQKYFGRAKNIPQRKNVKYPKNNNKRNNRDENEDNSFNDEDEIENNLDDDSNPSSK